VLAPAPEPEPHTYAGPCARAGTAAQAGLSTYTAADVMPPIFPWIPIELYVAYVFNIVTIFVIGNVPVATREIITLSGSIRMNAECRMNGVYMDV
jgi:hypothetical protein